MYELLGENRRRRRPEVADRVAAMVGRPPSGDDFLPTDAVAALEQAAHEQWRCHNVWHRIFGDRLRGELARTLRELAAALDGAEAFLLSGAPVEAVRVPVATVLRHE